MRRADSGDAAQGLCPKCLLRQAALPTEAGKTAEGKSAPPTIEELAAAFPQLEILGLIGQGGMGFVFKARQPKLDRLVALKISAANTGGGPGLRGKIQARRQGAGAAEPSQHRRHSRFWSSRRLFHLLMEFVDGVELRQAMRAGRFTPAQALAVVPKICEALQFAHNEGVLHRDIKPENILLDVKGRVKIADFGIAKLVGELHADAALTGTSATLGTPNYMAPEQIENSGDVDHRADIYSLGVVFYEMLTGGLPIGHFALPSEKSYADPRLDEVVLRTLEKDRERRTQTAGEVKTQVETIAASAGAPRQGGRPVPTAAVAAQPKPDQFWRWFAVAVLALIAIPVGLAFLGLLAAIAIPNFVKARERALAVRAQMEAANHPLTGFETLTNGVYTSGAVLEGWTVTSNQVGIVTDPNGAHSGANYLALTSGRIARTFPTKRGVAYQLQFHGKGPGLTDWWPGDGNANDIIGHNNGILQNMTFDDGKVNQAFHFGGDSSERSTPWTGFGAQRAFIPDEDNSEVDFGANAANFGAR